MTVEGASKTRGYRSDQAVVTESVSPDCDIPWPAGTSARSPSATPARSTRTPTPSRPPKAAPKPGSPKTPSTGRSSPASTPGVCATISASPPSAPGWPPTRTPTRRRPAGWSLALVDEILSNPKYTGHQVMGRRRFKAGKGCGCRPANGSGPPSPPCRFGGHGHLGCGPADEPPARQRPRPRNAHPPAAAYKLRSRLYCSICHRRMTGNTIRTYTYYRCPHDPGLPRHYAAHPVTAPSPSAKRS